VIAQAVLIALNQIVLAFSIKITWNIYKNFKKQDLTLFLTSLSVMFSIVFETVTLSMQFVQILEDGEERVLFYHLYRSFVTMSMLFII
jgi:hypothetical protein